jgi:acyl carrier protein
MTATASSETKNQLRRVIVEALKLDQDPDTIPDEGLRNKLGIDSVTGLELLIWVENEFGIQIDDGDLSVELIDSLDVLGAYVERCLAENNAA